MNALRLRGQDPEGVRWVPSRDVQKPFAGRTEHPASTWKAQSLPAGKNERDLGNLRCVQMPGSEAGSTPNTRKFQPKQVVLALGFVLLDPDPHATPAAKPQIKSAPAPVSRRPRSPRVGPCAAGVTLLRERVAGGTPGLSQRGWRLGSAPAPPPASPAGVLRGRGTLPHLAARRGTEVSPGAGAKIASL